MFLAWETFYHQCKPERHAESWRSMLSHGDLKGQRAVTMQGGAVSLLSWQSCVGGTELCHLAASMGVIFVDGGTFRQDFYRCSYYSLPLRGSMVDLWSVWMSSWTVQCYDRLPRSIRAHSQSQTCTRSFTLRPGTHVSSLCAFGNEP